jgi:hypothetical protein
MPFETSLAVQAAMALEPLAKIADAYEEQNTFTEPTDILCNIGIEAITFRHAKVARSVLAKLRGEG